jgi:hypothetical protein
MEKKEIIDEFEKEGGAVSIYEFVFEYTKKTDLYKEYDGETVYAPDEKEAWEIFLGSDGKFKMPDGNDYAAEKKGLAYKFSAAELERLIDEYGWEPNPDGCLNFRHEAWMEAVGMGICK